MSKIKAIPTSICGVFLALTSLGNYWVSQIDLARTIFGILALLALGLLLLKIICFPKDFFNDMRNPIICSLFAATFMGISIISTYIPGGKYLWMASMAAHIVLIVEFTATFIFKNFMLQNVHTTYFLLFVGFSVNGIVAPVFHQELIGRLSFYFGFISLLVIGGLVIFRYIKYPSMPDSLKPLFCIFAAPVNLCLAAYLQAFSKVEIIPVIVMLIIGLTLYVIAFIRLIMLLRRTFYPSYAAFTFPFVISAVASKITAGFLNTTGYNGDLLGKISYFQGILATGLTLYVLTRFLLFVFLRRKSK